MEHNQTDQLIDWIRNRYFGKYRGVVTDSIDPTNRGRIKVKVPAVLSELESWAMPCVPYAGKNEGFYTIPAEGAGVWIEFEAGDLSYPIWTGCFWADAEIPKDQNGTEVTPPVKAIRSEKGLMITFNDSSQELTLSDENGNNTLNLKVQKGLVTIKGKMKVVVEAPQIELVENATHPVVFGDELLNYLNQLVQIYNTHLHPGELAQGVLPVTPAPPAPPVLPPTPSLISSKVKSG